MAWARAEGVEPTGPNGLLTGVTKRVLETILETETAAEPRDERVTQPAQAGNNPQRADRRHGNTVCRVGLQPDRDEPAAAPTRTLAPSGGARDRPSASLAIGLQHPP